MFEEYGDMLSIDDVMEMLGIGRNSVYELLNSGELAVIFMCRKS